MSDKFKGQIKWYSIRKAWGFVTPSGDDDPPTKEDIFFHQTSINSEEKNKWLDTGYEVEFDVYTDEDGKYKCKTVSARGGGPCEIPKRPNRKRGKGGKTDGDGDGEEGEVNENGETKATTAASPRKGGRQPRKRFDNNISADVKEKMKEKKFDMRQTSLLVTVEKARLKFGPEGYAALCHADGIMAEGSFECDDDGKVTLAWTNMLKYEGDEWKSQDLAANTSSGVLIDSFNWTDENVGGMKTVETPESLWGEGKTDESEALESNNFQMRKCFLAKVEGKPRGNKRRPRTRGGKKAGDEGANGKAENGDKEENDVKTEEETSS